MIPMIHKALETLASFEDVDSVVLFRRDGTILDSILQEEVQQERLRLLEWMYNTLSSITREFSKGRVSDILFGLVDGKVLFVSGKSSVVAVSTITDANISLIKIQMKQTSTIIENLISSSASR